MRLSEKTQTTLLVIVITVLVCTLAVQIGSRVLYELSGAFNGDSTIYWAVGRGLVSGLTLYQDMFDIKPPGMFVVSALSYALTDSTRLCNVLQGLVLALLPLTMIVPILILQRGRDRRERLLGICLSLAFMGSITMYTALHGGEFQTESFGVFLVCAYVGAAAVLRERRSQMLTGIAGIFFFGGIVFKEPFLLAAIVGGVLLCRSLKDMVRIVVIPCVIGLALFVLTLLLLGALPEYLTTYLPFMLGNRTQRFGSPFRRALLLEAVWMSVWDFSPLFAIAIVLIWLAAFAKRSRMTLQSPRTIGCGIAFLIGLYLFDDGAVTVGIFPWNREPWYLKYDLLRMIAGILLMLYAGQEFLKYRTDRLARIADVTIVLIALGAIGFMAGLSGEFRGHHMLFAVPIYMALALTLMDTRISATTSSRAASVALLILLIWAIAVHDVTDTVRRRAEWTTEAAGDQRLADTIDTVLTACDIPRYLITGETETNVFGYTRHSPLGPIFFQQTLIGTYPPFTLAYVDQLMHADVILAPKVWTRESLPGLFDYVRHDFSAAAPACAGDSQLPKTNLHLLFRRKHSELTLNVTKDGKARLAFTPEADVDSK